MSKQMLTGRVLAAFAVVALAACGSSTESAGTARPSSPAGTSGPVLQVTMGPLGAHLADGAGNTVYIFAADTPGHSACTGSCLTYWPAVSAPAAIPTSVAGVTAAVGAITRPDDGSRQLTVDGRPVYTYSGDASPGVTAGQGLNASGGLWWVVSPSGAEIMSAAPSGASPSTDGPAAGHGY